MATTPAQPKPTPKTANPDYREGFRAGFRSAAAMIAQLVGQQPAEDKVRLSQALERIDTELLALEEAANNAPKLNGALKK